MCRPMCRGLSMVKLQLLVGKRPLMVIDVLENAALLDFPYLLSMEPEMLLLKTMMFDWF